MDNAVALVQAYLRVNGYFTVTEYPVIAKTRRREYRTATDLDVLAFRFPGAGRLVPSSRTGADEYYRVLDDALAVRGDQPDMIIAEVKEGHAVVNEAATDPGVLRAVLTGFGCCSDAESADVIETLIAKGRADLPNGHTIRVAVFASLTDGADPRFLTISLGHVLRFLRSYIDGHWDVLHHSENKDPAFGFLTTMAKAERGAGAQP